LLGVVEGVVDIVGGQDDGGGIYAARQAAAAGFVDTGFEEAGAVVVGEEMGHNY
jgi:hypothetical protein